MSVTLENFIRPSSIERLSLCPGSAQMSAAFVNACGEQPSSDVADKGTAVHEWAADLVKEWKAGVSWDLAINNACNSATVNGIDSWSVLCIRLCGEFYRELIATLGAEPENVHVEHRLEMSSFGFTKKGTADLVIVIPFKEVTIVDIKAGFIDQGDADQHDQLSVYSVAAAETFECDKVSVVIFQPRAERKHRASRASSDVETLRANGSWARVVTDAARKPGAELVPSYTACLYCPCLALCPAAKEYIMRAQEALSLIGKPTSAEGRGELLSAAKVAEKWAEDVKGLIKPEIMAGEAATGWKLGTPRAMRTVAQVPAAIQALEARGMGAMAMAAVSLSLTKLPPEAAEVIAEFVVEKLSDPPLMADKRTKGAA